VEIEIKVRGDTVTEARFLVYGCPASVAAAEELVTRIEGRDLLEAAAISQDQIASALELSDAKRQCSNLAVDAFHSALEDAWGRGALACPEGGAPDTRGVVVGMSGGVDSAVAALALQEQGYLVLGVTFRLWSDPVCAKGRSCCSPETISAARRTAHRLGLPHLTIDLSARFRQEVVANFIGEYAAARTPNPCVRCNGDLRFAALAEVADRFGLYWIATGHYARLIGSPRSLHRGRWPEKDQSYVLAQVPDGLLARTLFPLGESDKATTRERAREAGLEVHDAPESQEICFIPDDDYRRFLRERLGEKPGPILGPDGQEVGSHTGLYNFTIGQRKGLGSRPGEPQYVIGLRPRDNAVMAGPADALGVRRVSVGRVVSHSPLPPGEMLLQVRSSGNPLRTRVRLRGDHLLLELEETARGIAPGQAAVLYEGDRVVAAGTILAAEGPADVAS
jgi:tRNA-uridine 2-sulfurtransferase